MLKQLNPFQIGAITIFILMLCVWLLPEWTWGFNHIYFVPNSLKLVLIATAVIFYWIFRIESKNDYKWINIIGYKSALIGLPILSIFLTFLVPLTTNVYGDARSILSNYNDYFNSNDSVIKSIQSIFEPDFFNLHTGEKLTFSTIYLIKQTFGFDLELSFKVFGCIVGGFSAYLFVHIAKRFNHIPYLISSLLFISLNSILIFSGHVEVYALALMFGFLYSLIIKKYLEDKSKLLLLSLIIVQYFLLKSHISMLITIVPTVALILAVFKTDIVKYYTIKNTLILLGIAALCFLFGYFIILESHNSNYAARGGDITLNVFLPLFSSEAPYNNYGLLNLNHIVDFTSLVLMWSVPCIVIISTWLINKELKKWVKLDFERNIYLFILIGFGAISFVINPLLSMPRDWDLLSIGAPFLLIFTLNTMQRVDVFQRTQLAKVIIIGIVLFVLPRFIVEGSNQLSSNRILSLGSHVYKTYYAGSSVLLSAAIKEQKDPNYEFIKDFAIELSDKSKIYPDNELCHFFTQAAYWLAEERNKKVLALDFFRLALEHNNNYEIALKGAAILLQNNNDISGSLPLVQRLLEIQPNIKEYHLMLLNCYVALKQKKELQTAVNNYLKLFPEDRKMINSKLGF